MGTGVMIGAGIFASTAIGHRQNQFEIPVTEGVKLRQVHKDCHIMDHDHHHAAPDIPRGAETAKDPVCGMTEAVKPDGRHAAFGRRDLPFLVRKMPDEILRRPVVLCNWPKR